MTYTRTLALIVALFVFCMIAPALSGAVHTFGRITHVLDAPTPESCAADLGIAYSIEEGATERLDAFSACVSR